MSEIQDDTIMDLVTNLKATVNNDFIFKLNSPLKRSASSESNDSSLDERVVLKKPCSDRKFDMTYLGSPREIRRLRADLVEARNTILNLESRVQHMHNIRKKMNVMFDNETKELKYQHECDRKSVEDLENQLQSVRQREIDVKKQLAEMTHKYNVMKIRKDEEIDELEKNLVEIKEESRIFEGEENGEISSLNRRVNELEVLLKAAQDDAEANKKLVDELKNQVSDKTAALRDSEVKDHQLQVAKLRIKELEYAKENFLEFQVQAKTQTQKLANYVELQKENKVLKEENTRLKDEVRNKLILEEEVHDLKSRISNHKKQEKKLATLQMQQVQMDVYLNEWKAVARGICESTEADSSLPHLLRTTVERLQHQEVNLTAAKIELESQLNNALYDVKLAKAELEKCRKVHFDAKKLTEDLQLLNRRLSKKVSLVTRERDSYRLQLDSYEKDLTMCINPTTVGSPNANQFQIFKEKAENLEKIVDNYRDLVAKLENDLQNSNPSLYPENTSKDDQLLKYQDEISQLRLENDRLRERKDQLEIQLEENLLGHDTLNGGQVFHMVKNPLSDCLAEREQLLEKAQQEIERLKKKIKSLEEGIEVSKLNESAFCQQEVQTLKEKLENQETQMEIVKNRFQSSIQEFRTVIYMLFGYKIDRTSTSMYKLTSQYADHEGDHLCFQLNSENEFNLLENNFSATLEEMVNLHLKHQNSIPVFLSAITMDLFSNKTMATKTFEID